MGGITEFCERSSCVIQFSANYHHECRSARSEIRADLELFQFCIRISAFLIAIGIEVQICAASLNLFV